MAQMVVGKILKKDVQLFLDGKKNISANKLN